MGTYPNYTHIYWRYFRYVVRHRWYVMIACLKLGLWWQWITHDLSKFSRAEFGAYARWFNTDQGIRFKGLTRPVDNWEKLWNARLAAEFDAAWLHHQHANPHHWEYWHLRQCNGTYKPLPMPERYMREMVADWAAAGLAQGKGLDLAAWWEKNMHGIDLAPETFDRVEALVTLLMSKMMNASQREMADIERG